MSGEDVVALKIDASQGVRAYQDMVEASARASEAQAKFTAAMALSGRGMDSAASAAALVAQNAGRMSSATQGAADSHARLVTGLGATAAHLDGVSTKLDFVGKAAGLTSTALDAIGFVPAGVAAAEMSAKIDSASAVFGTAGSVVGYFSRAIEETGKASAAAADAEAQLGRETGSNTGLWIISAIAVAALSAATYGAYKAVEAGAGAVVEANDAFERWLGSISGVTAAEIVMTAESRAAFEAIGDLNRILGVGTENLLQLGAVAKDYGVSQESANATMRHMVDLLEEDSDKTHAARVALEAYIGSLDGLSGKDWATVLDRYAQAMNGYADSTRKTADAQLILGQRGTEFLKGIANGAADVSHATSESDRMLTAANQRLAESNRLIAQMKPDENAWTRFADLFDRMTTRSQIFKDKQTVIWVDFQADLNKVNATHVSWLDKVSQRWDLIKRSAGDYIDLLQGKYVPPMPKTDDRPGAPIETPKALFPNGTASQELADMQKSLQERQLLKENWLKKDYRVEIDYWAEQKALHEREFSESMSVDEMKHDATLKGINEHYQRALRSQAQYEEQQAQQAATAAEQAATAAEQARQKDLTGQMRQLEEMTSAARQGSLERIGAAQKEVEFAYSNWGTMSQQYKNALEHMLQADREYAAESRKARQSDIGTEAQRGNASVSTKQEDLSFGKSMGTINGAEEIAILREIAQQKHDIAARELQETFDNSDKTLADARTLAKGLESIEQQRSLAVRQIDHQETLGRLQEIKAWTEPFKSAINSMVSAYISGTQNMRQIAARALQSILASYAASGISKLFDKGAEAVVSGIAGKGASAALGLGDKGAGAAQTAATTANTTAITTLTAALTGNTAATTTNAGATTANATATTTNAGATITNAASTDINTVSTDIAAVSTDIGTVSQDLNTTATESNTIELIWNKVTGFFASGTFSAPRGPAVVGEEGPELAISRDGSAALVGIGGPMVMNMQGGEKIYTASQTAAALASGSSRTLYSSSPALKLSAFAAGTSGAAIVPRYGLPAWLTNYASGKSPIGGSSPVAVNGNGRIGARETNHNYSPTLTVQVTNSGSRSISPDDVARAATQALRNGHRDFIKELRKTV